MPIQDGIVQQVSGTVVEVFHGKTGVSVKLEVQNPRSQYPDRVTAWGVTEPVAKGDRLTVRGSWSWKKTVKGEKVYVDFSINQPVIVEHEAGKPAEATTEWDAVEPPTDWIEPGQSGLNGGA